MNKLLPFLAFSILLLVPVGHQDAFGIHTTKSVGNGGNWLLPGTWDNGVPDNGATVIIQNGDIVSVGDTIILQGINLIVEDGGTLIIDGFVPNAFLSLRENSNVENHGEIKLLGFSFFGSGGFELMDSTMKNFGKITISGGVAEVSSGFLIFTSNVENTCSGEITIIGGAGFTSGAMILSTNSIFTNHGLIDLTGGTGELSGIFSFTTPDNTLNSHNTINQNGGPGVNSGIIFVSGVGNTLNLNLPNECVVGGEIIPIESTSLILAGAQSYSWMIPVTLSILGIGLFVVSRKSEN